MGSRKLHPHEGSGLWSAYLQGYYPYDYCAECGRSDATPHTDSCSLGMSYDAADRGHAIKDGACYQCCTRLGELDFAISCPAGPTPGLEYDPEDRRTETAHR